MSEDMNSLVILTDDQRKTAEWLAHRLGISVKQAIDRALALLLPEAMPPDEDLESLRLQNAGGWRE